MSVLPILKWPDERLSTPCERVSALDPALETLAADMLETMYDAPGRGLAGPQVGAMIRMFVMDTGWRDGTPTPAVMVNPEIAETSDESEDLDEGCLSIPGITARVTRSAKVRMRWMSLDGMVHDEWLDGAAARVAQHEFDHLDGIVTLDRLDGEARAEAEKAYAG